MNKNQLDRRDFFQNILIVVLSFTSVLLIAQTQLYHLGSITLREHLDFLLEDSTQTGTPAATAAAIPAAPVHVAVTGTYGRYGNTNLISSADDFLPLGDLLKEALGSAKTYTTCTQADFLQALNTTSIYYDFLSPLPLSILGDLTGTTVDSTLQAQRLILSAQSNQTVRLFLWEPEGNTFQYCGTAISRGDLETVAGKFELGNAVFAFELAEENGSYTTIDPCSLFLPDSLPQLPVLQIDREPTETDAVLAALHFNPRTNYRYPESDGTEVVVEGERSLRIHPDGMVSYRSGGESTLSIETAIPDAPTLSEAVAGTSVILQKLLNAPGDAQLYLKTVHQSDNSTVLLFGYHINGIPVRFANGSNAAEVTLTGSTVSSLSLNFRHCTVTGETSLLLPLQQALAIASKGPGAELSIGYADTGSDKLSACWLAD